MEWKLGITSFLLLASAGLLADTIEPSRNVEDHDVRALREWIDTKRQITLKEIGGDLSLSGEVRAEFQSSRERSNGQNMRVKDSSGNSPRGYDADFNLMLDYRTDRTWASIKLRFDDDMGVFYGTRDKISLDRAYWGVRPIQCDTYTFDIEVGRRSMSSIFDSKVMFGSLFDGVLFRYDQAFEKAGDYYARLGAFVVNDHRDHIGYVGETGLLNIAGTGLYSKLSTVWWDTKSYPNEEAFSNRFGFLVSQLTAGYRFRVESINKIGTLYSAFLYNWKAEKLSEKFETSINKRAPWACYAGISVGKLLKQWDWSFDCNYQIVLAQAVPDFDCSGISLGNSNKSGFYTVNMAKKDEVTPSTIKTAAGTTNYHGCVFRLDLLLTDKLNVQQVFLRTRSWDKEIGPSRSFMQYEIEFIYSW